MTAAHEVRERMREQDGNESLLRALVARRLLALADPPAGETEDWEARADALCAGGPEEHRETLTDIRQRPSRNGRDPFGGGALVRRPLPEPRLSGKAVCLLDIAPLALALCPLAGAEAETAWAWLRGLRRRGVLPLIPEAVELTLRHQLTAAGRGDALRRLALFRAGGYVLPLTAWAKAEAARFWDESRRSGRPAAVLPERDTALLLAGQAATLAASAPGGAVIVATGDPGPLTPYCDARHWPTVLPAFRFAPSPA